MKGSVHAKAGQRNTYYKEIIYTYNDLAALTE